MKSRNFIRKQFGEKYLPEKPNFYASSKSAQQAHEAIRPTDVDLTPNDIRSYLTDEQFKLYDLIWRRFVACQMTAAVWDVTNLNIIAETSIGKCLYRTTGRVLVFRRFHENLAYDVNGPAVTAGKNGAGTRRCRYQTRAAFHEAACQIY